jgi:hypothetical protein
LCCSPQEEALSNTATLQDGWRCGSRLGVAHGPGGRLFLHRLGACVAGNKDIIIMSCLVQAVQQVPATHRHRLQAVRKRKVVCLNFMCITACRDPPAGWLLSWVARGWSGCSWCHLGSSSTSGTGRLARELLPAAVEDSCLMFRSRKDAPSRAL